MCQIQLIMSNELSNNCVDNFLELLEEGSSNNGDATGVFGERFTWKKPIAYESLKEKKVGELLEGIRQHSTNWLVGHNRLATHGSKENNVNNHPFENSTCVVVHNGVLYNDDQLKAEYGIEYTGTMKGSETDSAIVPALIDHFVTEKGLDEVDAIKSTAELIQGGYSIIVKMKDSGRLFYFKNNSQSFSFLFTEDNDGNESVYGSTSKRSLEDMGYIKTNGIFKRDVFKRRVMSTPSAGMIYELVFKDRLSVLPLTKFEVRKGGSWSTYSGRGMSNWDYHDWDAGRYIGTNSSSEGNNIVSSYADEIDEDFEDVLADIIENGFWTLPKDIMETANASHRLDKTLEYLTKDIDITYHEGREQIVMRNVSKVLAERLMHNLEAVTEWYDDKIGSGYVNLTISYDAVRKYLDLDVKYKSDCECKGDCEPVCSYCREEILDVEHNTCMECTKDMKSIQEWNGDKCTCRDDDKGAPSSLTVIP